MTKFKIRESYQIALLFIVVFLVIIIKLSLANGFFPKFTSESDIPEVPECGYNQVLGEDFKCYEECGDKSYCPDNGVCYNEECYLYPTRAIQCYEDYMGKIEEFASIAKLYGGTHSEAVETYNSMSNKFNEIGILSNLCYNYFIDDREALTALGYNVDTFISEMTKFNYETKDSLDDLREDLQS